METLKQILSITITSYHALYENTMAFMNKKDGQHPLTGITVKILCPFLNKTMNDMDQLNLIVDLIDNFNMEAELIKNWRKMTIEEKREYWIKNNNEIKQ
jgi:hypothetical protein